jgi:Putative ATPase subunit of terminase (gpP-like)
MLASLFEKESVLWKKERILAIAKKLGLSEASVYKWNWDKYQRLANGSLKGIKTSTHSLTGG